MAAPKENQFWKLRTKHGRDKLFSTPDILWEAATEYFEWCDNHKWERAVITKIGIVDIPIYRPYSLSGLCLYLNVHDTYLWELKRKTGDDFTEVISRIEKIIETQQFEGAAVGVFNANIIARKLGIPDSMNIKQESIIKGMTKDQIAEILSDEDAE